MPFVVCPSWPNYEINEYGEVRGKKGIRKPYLTTTGYLYIAMRNKGLEKVCAVHRLVAEAFIGSPPEGKNFVAHWDGNKTNNFYKNLRYASKSENEMDKVRHGRSNRGESFARSVLKEHQVIEIKRDLSFGSHPADIAKNYGVATTTIKSIKQGKSWAWL